MGDTRTTDARRPIIRLRSHTHSHTGTPHGHGRTCDMDVHGRTCNMCRFMFMFMFVSHVHVHVYITTQVIASVEKYENAGMKFSTVPAFTLAESRASDACCLFLVQKTHTREVSLFSSPGKFRPSCAFWINCTRGERTASTHELRPVPFPCATCRPPPMQPCCDACIVSPC